jgi:integrase
MLDATCFFEGIENNVELITKINAFISVTHFQSNKNDLIGLLQLASKLSDQIHDLKQAFPNLSSPFHSILCSTSILNELPEEHLINVSDRFIYLPLVILKVTCDSHPEKPNVKKVVAFIWLVILFSDADPVLSSLNKLFNISSFPIKFYNNMDALDRKLLKKFREASFDFAKRDFEKLAQEFDLILNLVNLNTDQVISNTYFLKYLMESLANIEITNKVNDSPKKLVSMKGIKLPERARLLQHISSFTDAELSKIRELMTNKFWQKKPFLSPKYEAELLLTGLALFTGRSVPCMLESNFYAINKIPEKRDNEYFVYTHQSKKLGTLIFCLHHQNEVIKLHLPDSLRVKLYEIVDSSQTLKNLDGETLINLLPKTWIDWPDRVEDLFRSVQINTKNIHLKLRDTLSKFLYAESANPAVLSILTSPKDIIDTQNSLVSYLQYPSKTLKIYHRKATNAIFKNDRSELELTFEGDGFEDLKQIFSSSEKRIADMQTTGPFWQHHNAISNHVLLLLIITTGHRESRTPFTFRWDILLNENLVFIADKIVVGSEARFVPIPEWVAEQLKSYFDHLKILAKSITKTNPTLAQKIFMLVRGQEVEDENDTKKPLGLFFTLDERQQFSALTTSDIELYYKDVAEISIKELRRRIASYFFDDGLSGMQIEAFLGHNSHKHVFGSTSSWTVKEWANQIRPYQLKYLELAGWHFLPLTKNTLTYQQKSILSLEYTPNIHVSNTSYESRENLSKISIKRARKALKSCMPEEWFYRTTSITEKEYKSLKTEATQMLAGDNAAINKLNVAMYQIRKQLSHHKVKLDSSTIHLTKSEAGPIEVFSSRYVRIAEVMRRAWFERVIGVTGDKSEISLLTQIAISLIINDAVLYEHYLFALISTIKCHQIKKINACFVINVNLQDKHKVYDKTIIISPFTSTLIIQLLKYFPSKTDDENKISKTELEQVIKNVKQNIRDQISRLTSKSNRRHLTIKTFMYVFSAWWQIKLPGAIYAIAIGDFAGPSPDLISETQFFSDERLTVSSKVDVKALSTQFSHRAIRSNRDQSKIIRKRINAIFNEAEGCFEALEQKSASQKRALNQLLTNEMDDYGSVFKVVHDDVQIVQLLVGFVFHMLKYGGSKEDTLAFSSIRTYTSTLFPLLDLFWDEDLEDQDPTFFTEKYAQFLKELDEDQRIKNDVSAIKSFHQYLRHKISAPYCFIASSGNDYPVRTRGGIIPVSVFEEVLCAIDQLNNSSSLPLDNNDFADHIKLYVYLGMFFGLRRKEVYGLAAQNLNALESLDVLSNTARSLKTSASKRRVHGFLLDDLNQSSFKKIINTLKGVDVEQLNSDPAIKKDRINWKYLFKNDGYQEKSKTLQNDGIDSKQLVSTRDIDVILTALLRDYSQNNEIVPHSMRHTFATRIAHSSFNPPRQIPLSTTVEKNLGILNNSAIFDDFEGGFHRWPFWVDKAAMMMGHADENTLLDVYWHTSTIRLAEYTWNESQQLEGWKDEHLSSLLGVHRKTILNARKSNVEFKTNPEGFEKLVKYYVDDKSDVETLAVANKIANVVAKDDHILNQKVGHRNAANWRIYDELLCIRYQYQLDDESLVEQINSANVTQDQYQRFKAIYENIVADTDFIDFEPRSNLVDDAQVRKSNGVIRGKKERQASLAKIQREYRKSPEFADVVNQVCDLWIRRVNHENPWFVARNNKEFDLIKCFLETAGVLEEQIEISRTLNFLLEGIDDAAYLSKFKISLSNERLSKGSKKSSSFAEIGFRVKQKRGASLGDGIDTHRLMILLACCVELAKRDS